MNEHKKNTVKKRRLIIPVASVVCIVLAVCFMIPYVFNITSGYTTASEYVALNPNLEPSNTILIPEDTLEPTLTPQLTLVPVETETPDLLLKVGDESEVVEQVQIELMSLGYMDSDVPTRYFGEPLRNAIMIFQRNHYLSQTGDIDGALLDVIMSDDAKAYYLERGNRGNDVLRMQMRLSELGFYQSKLNGYFGAATENALSTFQAMNQLVVTGNADSDTFNILYSPYARNSVGETPAPIETPTPVPTPTPTPRPTNTPRPTPTPRPTQTPRPSDTPELSHDPTQTPVLTPTYTPTPTLAPTPTRTPDPTPDHPVSGDVEEFIEVAMAQLGKPYVWSTEGPDSFDCSGFVYFCLRSIGLNVPRLSAQGFSQVESWERIDRYEDLRRGDLIFYANSSGGIGHTGIYLGDGYYIHASSSADRVVISDWGSWSNTYFRLGRRVFD